MEPRGHRKRVKHIDRAGHAHALTFSCYRRFPLLEDERHRVVLAEAIDRAIDRAMTGQGFLLHAFVFMPEHVHLLVFPKQDNASISRLLAAIKRQSSYRIKQLMVASDHDWLGRLTVVERPGKTVFRYWQEGSGYDRNIDEPQTFQATVDYIHANPVRRGLCATAGDWAWSSWQAYEGTGEIDERLPHVETGVPL